MASFPTSVKSFTSKVDGVDYPQAVHVNDLQDEVNAVETYLGATGSRITRHGVMRNGKLSVSVASNNLTVAIKTYAGTDPSSGDPVYVNINGTIRTISAALSTTKNAGTNWTNAGASELATKEIDYFAYLVWDSNSSAVAVSFARIPNGRVVSDFSATTTNEKHMADYANFTSTDDVVNIGRFAATLSAGAGYTWTVPTFTNSNLIQEPVYETRWLNWVPTLTGFSANPTDTLYEYKIMGDRCFILFSQFTNGTSNATGFTATPPFGSATTTNGTWGGAMHSAVDNGAALTVASRAIISASTPTTISIQSNMGGGTWTAANGKRAIFNFWYKI
jgi:hypothetical protein